MRTISVGVNVRGDLTFSCRLVTTQESLKDGEALMSHVEP